MVISISIKDSKQTHRIRVHESFNTDDKGQKISWDKQVLKSKDIAHDMYGNKVKSVELIKD